MNSASKMKNSITAVAALCLAGIATQSMAATHYLVIPVRNSMAGPVEMSITLANRDLPVGNVNSLYSYSFHDALTIVDSETPSKSNVKWQLISGVIPHGLTFNANEGLLTGTPTEKSERTQISVSAEYKDKVADGSFMLQIDGVQYKFKKIAAGRDHTCGITLTDSIQCWGDNASGAAGTLNANYLPTPVDVTNIGGLPVEITAGNAHTCAILDGGVVKCWGAASLGQLGGSYASGKNIFTVAGLNSPAKSITAGGNHSCALLTDGAVKCWGGNGRGQLGNGTQSGSPNPTNVSGLQNSVKQIEAGDAFTCAVLTTGALMCWGQNDNKQLGAQTAETFSRVPVQVQNLQAGVRSVSAGETHACAVVTSGDLMCWGANINGQLGVGNTTPSSVPLLVSGMSGATTKVSVTSSATCALLESGAAFCWGWNSEGQLGIGSYVNPILSPTLVHGLGTGVLDITQGYLHGCALKLSGDALCWGSNLRGQVGNNSTTRAISPSPLGAD